MNQTQSTSYKIRGDKAVLTVWIKLKEIYWIYVKQNVISVIIHFFSFWLPILRMWRLSNFEPPNIIAMLYEKTKVITL